MEHLAIEIYTSDHQHSHFAVLSKGTSITITRTSHIFGEGDIWTFGFNLPIMANGHIFGTAGELRGQKLHQAFEKRKATIWIEGVPAYTGYIKLDDEVTVAADGDVKVRIESGRKTFSTMIEGGKANQIPMKEDVLIGMALWRKRNVNIPYTAKLLPISYDSEQFREIYCLTEEQTLRDERLIIDGDTMPTLEYPRTVVPKGVFTDQDNNPLAIDCLNTSHPYDANHPYCNVALCYQKWGYPNGYDKDPAAMREYELMPANRLNSAPNFYVLYWLDCLFSYLNINIYENQAADIGDLLRLFFVNTKCEYAIYNSSTETFNHYGMYRCQQDYGPLAEDTPGITPVDQNDYNLTYSSSLFEEFIDGHWERIERFRPFGGIAEGSLSVKYVSTYTQDDVNLYWSENRRFHRAYATSNCFPAVDINSVISALESAFGIRFLFDRDYHNVRIVLLRNILRNTDVQHLRGTVTEHVYKENDIKGFRMTYNGEKTDTNYYYKGFNDRLSPGNERWADNSDTHDYSQWEKADYSEIRTHVTPFNKTCYIDPKTANAYGVKIDEDAKTYDEYHPALFEYAGYMDAEDGDCSGEESTIHTVELNFTPAIMNDVSTEADRQTGRQTFALFVNQKMRPRRYQIGDGKNYNDADVYYDIETMKNDAPKSNGTVQTGRYQVTYDHPDIRDVSGLVINGRFGVHGSDSELPFRLTLYGASLRLNIRDGYTLYLQDNFEPTDDGISPIEKQDFGLMFGIMRGNGEETDLVIERDGREAEGNFTWDLRSGTGSVSHPDTCNDYGQEWAYQDATTQTASILINTAQEAKDYMRREWPASHVDLLNRTADNYLRDLYKTYMYTSEDDETPVPVYFAHYTQDGTYLTDDQLSEYALSTLSRYWATAEAMDAEHLNLIVGMGYTDEQMRQLLKLQRFAFTGSGGPIAITDETDRQNKISLKISAKKPNPWFNSSLPESETNQRYLQPESTALQGRGLKESFYPEFSYLVRNSKTSVFKVLMEATDIFNIDEATKIEVGGVIGWMKKMQFTVSLENGIGPVGIEILHI